MIRQLVLAALRQTSSCLVPLHQVPSATSLPISRLALLASAHRYISTSQKPRDAAASAAHGHDSHAAAGHGDSHGHDSHGHGHGHDEPVVTNWRHPSTELPKDYKEWTPFLNPFDKEEDTFTRRGVMFSFIVVMLCWGPFLWAYAPDYFFKDWAYREAFLEIERRRHEGLPLVSPDLVPPEKVTPHLPSDDELGDMEIIV